MKAVFLTLQGKQMDVHCDRCFSPVPYTCNKHFLRNRLPQVLKQDALALGFVLPTLDAVTSKYSYSLKLVH